MIYALETGKEVYEKKDPVQSLQKQFDNSRNLFAYLLYFLAEVARYAETDARIRSLKNLPSSEDLVVNTKIAGNELLQKILDNVSLRKVFKNNPPGFEDTRERVKKIYGDLMVSDLYRQYIQRPARNRNDEKGIVQFIFTDLMLPNEDFTAHIEDHFINWDDDAEMMKQLVLNYLNKPGMYDLQDIPGEEKWKFAKDLLTAVLQKKEYVTDLIKPKLINWDADRIALLDMILMQMGVCEFLFFETIPPKVTINEYIDIAKDYSTTQSGQFVNGILDNIHKELISQNKIHKIDFKQKSN